jgi:colanic acid/amylovoran biosynthesis glycosyltransferase
MAVASRADRPLDIVVVTGRFPMRSQSFIERKVLGLAERGHRVTVLAERRGDHALDAGVVARLGDRLRVEHGPEGGARVLRAAAGAASAVRRDPGFSLGALHALGPQRRLLKGLRFAGRRADVVHFEWVTKAVALVDVLDLLPGRVVVSCRGTDVRIMANVDPGLAAALPRVFARADLVHCVSQAVVVDAVTHGLDPARAFVNHPAVDPQWFAPDAPAPPAPPLRIVSVGRVHWVKGYDYALQAVRLLVDGGCDVRYTIVGGGDADAMAAARFTAHDLGIADRIEFLGAQAPDEVRRVLGRSHVLLLSSVSEGLSNAVLEAMAMELPVVVTDVGGMGEVVRDGVDGYLVPTRDPATWADRLQVLAADPALRARLGRVGRERVVTSFAIDDQIDRFVDRYRMLVAG